MKPNLNFCLSREIEIDSVNKEVAAAVRLALRGETRLTPPLSLSEKRRTRSRISAGNSSASGGEIRRKEGVNQSKIKSKAKCKTARKSEVQIKIATERD